MMKKFQGKAIILRIRQLDEINRFRELIRGILLKNGYFWSFFDPFLKKTAKTYNKCKYFSNISSNFFC